MISFKRNGREVTVGVESEISVTSGTVALFLFRAQFESETIAELVRQNLRDLYWKKAERTRRAEYEAGFRDGKRRKVKQDWFRDDLNGRASSDD